MGTLWGKKTRGMGGGRGGGKDWHVVDNIDETRFQ
jgi:hypothetical protein